MRTRAVGFTFHPDASTLAQADPSILAGQHPAFIRWTYFRAITRLAAADQEMLLPANPRNYHFRPLPLLDIGPWALARLRALPPGGHATYDCCDSGWCLQLTRRVNTLRLDSFYNARSVDMPYAGTLAAWERLNDGIRVYLAREAPALRASPFWRSWLDGAEYEELALPHAPAALGPSVVLDFEPDLAGLEEDRHYHVGTERMAVLTYTYFEMPVRFQAGGVEFFSLQLPHLPDVTERLPLLGFALGGLRALRSARAAGRGHYDIPEGSRFLRFEMNREDVLIQYHPLAAVATVAYEELLQTWEQFARRVCTYLLAHAPEIANNPEWSPSLMEAGLRDLL